MFKSLKTLAVASLLGVILPITAAFFFFGSDTPGLASAMFDNVRESARDAIPLELQLDRVRQELERADGEIVDHHEYVAEIEVQIEDLQAEIEKLEAERRAVQQKAVALRESYLATGNGLRHVALVDGRKVESSEVARALNEARISLQGLNRRLEAKQQLLSKREQNLQKALAALQERRVKSHELAVQLETRRVDVECAKISAELEGGPLVPEDSLREAERLLADVDTDIRIMSKVASRSGDAAFTGVGEVVDGDLLVQQVDELLGAELVSIRR